jgi:hypothetical protein
MALWNGPRVGRHASQREGGKLVPRLCPKRKNQPQEDESLGPEARRSVPLGLRQQSRRAEFYRVAFRKKLYSTIDELQADLDAFLDDYNNNRPHQGRWCFGKTPMQTFYDSLELAREKLLVA